MNSARATWVARLLVIFVTFIFYGGSAYAAELFVLALQNEGQATVAIDDKTKTAFIMDLGQNAEKALFKPSGVVPSAPALLFEEKVLLDFLAVDRGIENLVISCSHPHSDHMAGIVALFKAPAQSFFKDGDTARPRFTSITVIDDGVSDSLASLYESFAKSVRGRPDIAFKRESATDRKTGKPRNAFATTATLQSEVHIENIDFPRTDKAGVHGRSLITLTRLGGPNGHVMVDFDDADSKAIASALKKMQDNGLTKIDTFIVPHHGSKAHDIEPILAMKPTRAIITVNPNNRYGHPSASILDRLMTELKPENVIFTGSTENVVLDQTGLKFARYTAAQRESAALFVANGKLFALKRQKPSKARDEEVLLFDKIANIMERGPPTDIPPENAGGGTPRPKNPSGGSSGLHASSESRIRYTGSILSASFDVGYIPRRGMTNQSLTSKKIFQTSTPSDTAFPLYINAFDADPSRTIATAQAEFGSNVMVFSESPTGIASDFHSVASARYVAPKVMMAKAAAPPHGGMVFLAGGKVMVGGDKLDLTDAKVVECKARICLETLSGKYELPFDNKQLFLEVWERVALKSTDAFYLSINPRKKFLTSPSNDWNIPSNKLRFGVAEPATGDARNDVVTAGDIQNSRIGQILWEADVAFKSAGLGVNAFSGLREREDLAVYRSSESSIIGDEDLSHTSSSRWCRMYWTSGNPLFDFNTNSKKIVTSGTAVVAQAEPMVLSSGELKSKANGRWCDREKALAASMQKRANDGSGPKVYQDLRQLALMQSFALWAKQHLNIESFNLPVADSVEFTVPLWTSGIRSATETVVQEEYIKSEHAHYVHFFANEAESFRCLDRLYSRIDDEWRAIGIPKVEGVWRLSESTKPVLKKWISAFSGRLASQCNARKRDSVNTIVSLEDEGSGKSAFGVHRHVLSSQIHGGILLGTARQRRPFESAYLPNATIWAPYKSDDHIVFRKLDNDLHFWNRIAGNGPEIAQHIVITDASIKDSYVKNGMLRFVVEVAPGSVVRKEMRAQAGRRFAGGVEWVEALYGSDGKSIRQTAAWPCTPDAGEATCLGVADASQSHLYELIGDGKEQRPKLDAIFVDTNSWVVELNLTGIDKLLTKENASQSTAQRIAAAQKLATWGYIEQVREDLAAILNSVSPTAQDTVLQELLFDEKEADTGNILVSILGLGMVGMAEDVSGKRLTVKDAMSTMAQVDQLAVKLPSEHALYLLRLLAGTCDSMQNIDVPAKPVEREGLALMCRTYGKKLALKSALVEGLLSGFADATEGTMGKE